MIDACGGEMDAWIVLYSGGQAGAAVDNVYPGCPVMLAMATSVYST